MEEYANDYKKLTQVADFILLVINKIVTVVNGRFAWHAADLNDFILSNNATGLKKKHNSWPELIKNYASFFTSINNMISMNGNMNYSRKQLIKNQDIEKNTEKLEVSTQKFIDIVETILLCLEFFSSNIDLAQTKSKEVQDMKSVHKIIENALEKLKKTYFPKVKQIKLDAKLKMVGGTEDGYQVIVGGENEKTIRIGGFNIEKTVKHDLIKLDLFEKDLESLRNAEITDIDNYIKKFIMELSFFSELASKSEKEIADFLMIRSMANKNLADQFFYIVTNRIPALIKYHQNRFAQQNEYNMLVNVIMGVMQVKLNYKDVYGEINTELSWNTLNSNESVQKLMELIQNIFILIDKADKNKILKDAKKCFAELNAIKDQKAYAQKLDELSDNYKIITDDFPFEARKNAKSAIQRLIKNILSLLPTTTAEKTGGAADVQNIDLLSDKPKNEKLALLTQLINNAKKTVNIETKLVPELKKQELLNDNLTNLLNELMIEINMLISPDNKYTCIKRPSLVLTTAISAVIMNKIKKRFPEEDKKSQILEKIKEVCDKMLEINTDQLYSTEDGLKINIIEKLEIV